MTLVVKEDEKYRKDILPKMVTILKEMREKAEAAAELEAKSSESEEDVENNTESEDGIAGDDFFMEE